MLARLRRALPMAFSVGRWYLAVGTNDWHNYIVLGDVLWGLEIVVGHFQFCGRLSLKPHWPHFYDGPRIFDRVLAPENKRWTDLAVGIQFWPVVFGVYWHTTCYGCVAEYSRDLDAYNEHRRELREAHA